MTLQFYNKSTGEPLPELEEGRQYIILFGELYECEFSSADSLEGNHIYNGEAWKVNVDWEVKIIQ